MCEVEPTGLEMLERVSKVMQTARTSLMELSKGNASESVTAILEEIETNIGWVETFVREEAYAKFATYNAEIEETIVGEVPQLVGFGRTENGESMFEFPLWLFAPRTNIRMRPPFHNSRSFIRTSQFWDALIGAIFPREYRFTELRRHPLENLDTFADIRVVVHSRKGFLRDWDHYELSPFINALTANRVIAKDTPTDTNFTRSYRPVKNAAEEKVIILVKVARNEGKQEQNWK